MYINKDEYEIWKNKVIKNFFTQKNCKGRLVPKINEISCLKKEKVIIVLDIFRNENKQIYSNIVKTNKNIPNKHRISLYHSGNKKNGSVSIGATIFSNKKHFLHPAIDFGGLTNYRQPLGKKARFLNKKPIKLYYNKPKKINSLVNKLYKLWKKYSKKNKLYGNIKSNLKKVILSVYRNKILNKGDYINLMFYKLPTEKAVISNSQLVIEKTGYYYNRMFNGDDKKYAKVVRNKKLICGILKNYITTNLHRNNLLNEYNKY